jgi:hypothetical protein
VNTIIENCVPMWPKKPSRVPGRAHTARTCASAARTGIAAPGAQLAAGALRTTVHARTATTAPTPAAPPNAVPQPAPCSTAANGTADTTWPSWHRIVVSCVMTGTRRAANHRGISASVAVNTTASPAPTSTRASTASGNAGATASRSWPDAITSALTASIRREPYRSTRMPAGSWAATYTAICTKTKVDRAPGETAKRCAASSPATPSVVRWATAST